MAITKPTPPHVWKAVQIYLDHAYDNSTPPSAVRARLDTLRALPPEDFYECAVFEKGCAPDAGRISLRLGNRFYPHMKLSIERAPDRRGYLFQCNTHDGHACPPPGTREYTAFRQLMEMNQTLAHAIELAWEAEGLPTFKAFLRVDLQRRKQGGPPSASGAASDPMKTPGQ